MGKGALETVVGIVVGFRGILRVNPKLLVGGSMGLGKYVDDPHTPCNNPTNPQY